MNGDFFDKVLPPKIIEMPDGRSPRQRRRAEQKKVRRKWKPLYEPNKKGKK